MASIIQALNVVARRLVEAKFGEEAANFLIDINRYNEIDGNIA